jgi:hypothetical protein
VHRKASGPASRTIFSEGLRIRLTPAFRQLDFRQLFGPGHELLGPGSLCYKLGLCFGGKATC